MMKRKFLILLLLLFISVLTTGCGSPLIPLPESNPYYDGDGDGMADSQQTEIRDYGEPCYSSYSVCVGQETNPVIWPAIVLFLAIFLGWLGLPRGPR